MAEEDVDIDQLLNEIDTVIANKSNASTSNQRPSATQNPSSQPLKPRPVPSASTSSSTSNPNSAPKPLSTSLPSTSLSSSTSSSSIRAVPTGRRKGNDEREQKGGDSDEELDALINNLDEVVTSPAAASQVNVAKVPSAKIKCYPPFVGGVQDSGWCLLLRCTSCDHQVIRIKDYKWHERSDLMFFRNNVPDLAKLQQNLIPTKGTCAYACQCSWHSTSSLTNISTGLTHLRWVCAGH